MALVTVVVIGSQACCERIVTLNDCRFVPSTASNVHDTWPDDEGSPGRSMSSVPVHVPSRKDRPGDGPVGPLASFPHPAANALTNSDNHARNVRPFITNLRIGERPDTDTAPTGIDHFGRR